LERHLRHLITGIYPYSAVLTAEQEQGEYGEELALEYLDMATQLIVRGEYWLDEITDPRLIARLIEDYSYQYGFSLDDLQDPEVRKEVERLL